MRLLLKRYFGIPRCFFVVILLSGLVTVCHADSISSGELINNAKLYDGKEITFQGEVIGDVMKRGDSSWVNINDGQNAVGIFFENSVSSGIKFTGDYDHRGDIVEINGIFHRACLEHGGDMDIHAAGIIKLEDGYKVIHKVDNKKLKAILWLSIILVIFTIGAVIKR